MGSLAGHVLPGCFFLVHGLIWTLLSMWMQLKARVSAPKKHKREGSTTTNSSTSFFEYKRDHGLSRKSWLPLPCCSRFPLEPLIKILLGLLGVIAEGFFDIKKVSVNSDNVHLVAQVYRVFSSDGHFNDLAKLHHITMYSAFMISGIMDIVSIFVKLPRQTSMIFYSVAYWVEFMLFYSHSHKDDSLNVHTHFILIIVIASCMVFSALRIFQSSHLLVNLGLSFCIMLQGTWFIQVGVSLYPPGGTNILIQSLKSHSEEHKVTMYVYALFTWHALLLALSFLGLWIVLACYMRSSINRRLAKFQSRSTRSNNLQNWMESDENERLIAVDEGGAKVDIGIEMQEVAETVS